MENLDVHTYFNGLWLQMRLLFVQKMWTQDTTTRFWVVDITKCTQETSTYFLNGVKFYFYAYDGLTKYGEKFTGYTLRSFAGLPDDTDL